MSVILVSNVYPKAFFSYCRHKQFFKSQCWLFISSDRRIRCPGKKQFWPQIPIPKLAIQLYPCNHISDFTFITFSPWSHGHNRLLCSPVWETICFSLINAHPHKNFTLSNSKKENLIFQCSYTVTELCLLAHWRLFHFWMTAYSESNLCRYISWF